MDNLKINVEVIDREICERCKNFKIGDELVKEKDAYGMEVEKRKIYCVHKKLCEHLLEHISEEKFLHMD